MQVQSHVMANVGTELDNMRRSTVYLLMSLCILFCIITCTTGYQISEKNSDSQDALALNSVTRIKRQLEDFETDDFSTTAAQQSEEESGFWDRMVKMALRLFNKFIEWLNAS